MFCEAYCDDYYTIVELIAMVLYNFLNISMYIIVLRTNTMEQSPSCISDMYPAGN